MDKKEFRAALEANLPYKPPVEHKYPPGDEVLAQGIAEAKKPGFTLSIDEEPDEKTEFSSRALTDWYVGRFVAMNNLKP